MLKVYGFKGIRKNEVRLVLLKILSFKLVKKEKFHINLFFFKLLLI